MRLIWFILLFLLSSCASWFEKPKKDEFTPPEPKVEKTEIKIPEKPNTGSLWSEDSTWNTLYTIASLRKQGDIVFLKPTTKFQKALNEQRKRFGEVRSLKEDKKRQPTSQKKNNWNDDRLIAARLGKRDARGVYTFQVKRNLDDGPMEEELQMYGKIRERDLDEKDTISTDMVFDMKLELTRTKKEMTPNEKAKAKAAKKAAKRRAKQKKKDE